MFHGMGQTPADFAATQSNAPQNASDLASAAPPQECDPTQQVCEVLLHSIFPIGGLLDKFRVWSAAGSPIGRIGSRRNGFGSCDGSGERTGIGIDEFQRIQFGSRIITWNRPNVRRYRNCGRPGIADGKEVRKRWKKTT